MNIGDKVIVEIKDDSWIGEIADVWVSRNTEELEFLIRWAEIEAEDADSPDQATGWCVWATPDMITPLEEEWIIL